MSGPAAGLAAQGSSPVGAEPTSSEASSRAVSSASGPAGLSGPSGAANADTTFTEVLCGHLTKASRPAGDSGRSDRRGATHDGRWSAEKSHSEKSHSDEAHSAEADATVARAAGLHVAPDQVTGENVDETCRAGKAGLESSAGKNAEDSSVAGSVSSARVAQTPHSSSEPETGKDAEDSHAFDLATVDGSVRDVSSTQGEEPSEPSRLAGQVSGATEPDTEAVAAPPTTFSDAARILVDRSAARVSAADQQPATFRQTPASTRAAVDHSTTAGSESRTPVSGDGALLATSSAGRTRTQFVDATSLKADQDLDEIDLDGLAASISRPLNGGDGTYTVTVAMHPPELGHVQAEVSLEGSALQVSISPQSVAGHDALANAADALRDQLAQGGMNVNVTIRDPGHQQHGGDERSRPGSPDDGSIAQDGQGPISTDQPALAQSQIHLVL